MKNTSSVNIALRKYHSKLSPNISYFFFANKYRVDYVKKSLKKLDRHI